MTDVHGVRVRAATPTPAVSLPAVAQTTRLPLSRAALPERDRPQATLTVLDITKWFGEGSGGVRTYLGEKARHVAAHDALRHVLVVPGPFDGVALGDGVRTYRVRGPLIPSIPPGSKPRRASSCWIRSTTSRDLLGMTHPPARRLRARADHARQRPLTRGESVSEV